MYFSFSLGMQCEILPCPASQFTRRIIPTRQHHPIQQRLNRILLPFCQPCSGPTYSCALGRNDHLGLFGVDVLILDDLENNIESHYFGQTGNLHLHSRLLTNNDVSGRVLHNKVAFGSETFDLFGPAGNGHSVVFFLATLLNPQVSASFLFV